MPVPGRDATDGAQSAAAWWLAAAAATSQPNPTVQLYCRLGPNCLALVLEFYSFVYYRYCIRVTTEEYVEGKVPKIAR